MPGNSRIFGDWMVMTPAEHDAIIAEHVNNTDPRNEPITANTLGHIMNPQAPGTPIFPSYHVLVVKPNGEPHEIPGTDQVAITPTWDPGVIYVLPKEASFPPVAMRITGRNP